MRAAVTLLVAVLLWALALPAYAVTAGPRTTAGQPAAGQHVAPEPDVMVEPGTGFTKAQVAEIRRLVSTSKVPAQVRILRRLPRGVNDSSEQLAQRLVVARHEQTGEASVAVVFSPRALPEFGAAETTRRQDVLMAVNAAEHLEGTSQEKFVELVRMSTRRTGAETLDKQMAAMWDDIGETEFGDPRHHEPPSTRKVVLRWLVLGSIVVLLGLFVLFRGRALLGWWRRRRRADDLTEAAVTARDKNLRDQARADVLAFGQAIDAESMDEYDALELWHLALEDYDEASRLLDASERPDDHRRVIEICARGRDRLAKAQRQAPDCPGD